MTFLIFYCQDKASWTGSKFYEYRGNKRMNSKGYTVIGLALILTCIVSGIAKADKKWEGNLSVGSMIPTNSVKHNEATKELSPAGTIQSSVYRWFGNHVALGWEGAITPGMSVSVRESLGDQDGDGVTDYIDSSKSVNLYQTHLAVKVGTKGKSSKIGQYIICGGGWAISTQRTMDGTWMSRKQLRSDGLPTAGVGGSNQSVQKTYRIIDSLDLMAGVGVTYDVNQDLSLGFDVRYYLVMNDGIGMVSPTFRLMF
jgi:hypothetical protein